MKQPVDRKSPLSIAIYVIAALVFVFVLASVIYGASTAGRDAQKDVNRIEQSATP